MNERRHTDEHSRVYKMAMRRYARRKRDRQIKMVHYSIVLALFFILFGLFSASVVWGS